MTSQHKILSDRALSLTSTHPIWRFSPSQSFLNSDDAEFNANARCTDPISCVRRIPVRQRADSQLMRSLLELLHSLTMHQHDY